MTDHSIAAEVLRCAPESRRRFLATGAVVALWLHALGVGVLALGPGRAPAAKPPRALRVEALEYAVDLPPAPTLQRGVLRSAPKTPVPDPAASSVAKPSPTPPAAAPRVVHAAPPTPIAPRAAAQAPPLPPEAVADFTSAGAPTYVGGTQSAAGVAAAATPAVGVPQGSVHGGGSMARSVGLAATQWRCPWPAEAESLAIDSQVVVLRAVVNSQGQALHVTLLTDPGHGFGAAALACAQTASFEPARDGRGAPYAATSPPIRVTFIREHL